MSNKNKDIFDLFRESHRKLDERPSADAWSRLEHRLDNRKVQSKRYFSRLSMMAASVIFLVGITAVLTLFLGQQHQDEMAVATSKPVALEELQRSNGSSDGLYKILESKRKMQARGANTFKEGTADKKLVANITEKKEFVPKAKSKPSLLALGNPPKPVTSPASAGTFSNAIDHSESTVGSVSTHGELDNKIQLETAGAADANWSKNEAAETLDANTADMAFDTEAKEIKTEKDEAASEEVGEIASTEAMEMEEAYDAYGRSDQVVVASSKAKVSKKEQKKLKKENKRHKKEVKEIEANDNVLSDLTGGEVSNLEQFKWLIGQWKGKNDMGQFLTEEWIIEDDYTMQGTGALVINGETTFTEDMSIQKIGDELYYILKLEDDNVEVRFKLKSNTGATAIFENVNNVAPDQLILMNNNNSNFSTILQNKEPNQLDLNQVNYLQNRNAVKPDQVTRNLDKIN